jgi:hypothetical protein
MIVKLLARLVAGFGLIECPDEEGTEMDDKSRLA